MSCSFLIFSGHNDRAVIALCRFFTLAGLEFSVIAAGPHDFIFNTPYQQNVIYQRQTKSVDKDLFIKALSSTTKQYIYCPTTEYINSFLLDNVHNLSDLNISIQLPPSNIYRKITSKKDSQKIASKVSTLEIPKEFSLDRARVPCVLKPIINIADDQILYPIICKTESELVSAMTRIEPTRYFAQEYIDGKSFYLCAFLAKSGAFYSYWQKNLLQQGNGKSIVLAVEDVNPDLDENQFFLLLHEEGYHGPLMMEVMIKDNQLYYIEINPRFWGPLQLAVDAYPELLTMYATESGYAPRHAVQCFLKKPIYYSWYKGALQGNLRNYTDESLVVLDSLIKEHDVFSRNDYRGNYGRGVHFRDNVY